MTAYSEDISVEDAAERLASVLERVPTRLLGLTETISQSRPRGRAWSRKQIIGHLIDSASNNHQRFVRAQFQQRMSFPPYVQDHWIAAQGYDERPWVELVELWRLYNLHLLHVMKRVPVSARGHVCTVSPSEPATLGDLMVDYVGHMQHHLDQILS